MNSFKRYFRCMGEEPFKKVSLGQMVIWKSKYRFCKMSVKKNLAKLSHAAANDEEKMRLSNANILTTI